MLANVPSPKKFISDVFWALASLIVMAATGFATSLLLGNLAGASALGLYAMANTSYTMVLTFAGLGISAGLVKYVAEYSGTKQSVSTIVSNGLLPLLVFGGISFSIFYFLAGGIADLLHDPELSILFKIVAFGFPFALVGSAFLSTLIGFRKMKVYTFVITLRSGLFIAIMSYLLFSGMGAKGAMLALILSEAGIFVLLAVLCRRFVTYRWDAKAIRKLLSFGWKIVLANGLTLGYTTADILLVGYFLTAADVGIYRIALMFINFPLYLSSAVDRIAFPATSEYKAKDSYDTLSLMVNRGWKYMLIFTTVLGTAIVFFSQEFVALLFPAAIFSDAVPLLRVLGFGLLAFGSVGALGSSFSGVGRPDVAIWISVVTAIVVLSLDILLIPRFGLMGASLAKTSGWLIYAAITFYWLPRILGIKVTGRSLGRIFALSAALYLGLVFLSPHISGIAMKVLIFSSAIAGYILILILSKTFDSTDRQLLHRIVQFRLR